MEDAPRPPSETFSPEELFPWTEPVPDAQWMTNHLEDAGFRDQDPARDPGKHDGQDGTNGFDQGGFSKARPFLARTGEIYALQDEVKPFLRTYFNTLASLLNAEDLSLRDPLDDGIFNNTRETGGFLYQSRTMLLTERGSELWLAPFIPCDWLRDGMVVAVEQAPSRFGPLGCRIVSHAASGTIEVLIDPPTRRMPDRLVIRLRHPEATPMRAVALDGEAWNDFDAEREIVRLPPSRGKIKLRAEY